MADIHPLIDGKGTWIDKNTVEGTFATSEDDMPGFKMISAVIDESGYFVTIRWERKAFFDQLHEVQDLVDKANKKG